jgi:hypothetical protein
VALDAVGVLLSGSLVRLRALGVLGRLSLVRSGGILRATQRVSVSWRGACLWERRVRVNLVVASHALLGGGGVGRGLGLGVLAGSLGVRGLLLLLRRGELRVQLGDGRLLLEQLAAHEGGPVSQGAVLPAAAAAAGASALRVRMAGLGQVLLGLRVGLTLLLNVGGHLVLELGGRRLVRRRHVLQAHGLLDVVVAAALQVRQARRVGGELRRGLGQRRLGGGGGGGLGGDALVEVGDLGALALLRRGVLGDLGAQSSLGLRTTASAGAPRSAKARTVRGERACLAQAGELGIGLGGGVARLLAGGGGGSKVILRLLEVGAETPAHTHTTEGASVP